MDARLRTTLKLSIPAVLIACIGPLAALIQYPRNEELTHFYLYLTMFPFFCLSVYLSLKGSDKALAIWLGMLFYFLYWSTFIFNAAVLAQLLFMLSFSLLLSCIVAGWSFSDYEDFEFKFPNKIPRYAAAFVFLLNIVLIIAPIIAIHYLYPPMYESLSPDNFLKNSMFFGDRRLSFLYYDWDVQHAYKIYEPFFLYVRPKVTVFLYLPINLIALYLLMRKKKSANMISLILLAANGMSVFLFFIPSVAARLRDYSLTIFNDVVYMMRSGYDTEKLVTTVIEMKLVLFLIISVLSAILAFIFVARMRETSEKDVRKS